MDNQHSAALLLNILRKLLYNAKYSYIHSSE